MLSLVAGWSRTHAPDQFAQTIGVGRDARFHPKEAHGSLIVHPVAAVHELRATERQPRAGFTQQNAASLDGHPWHPPQTSFGLAMRD